MTTTIVVALDDTSLRHLAEALRLHEARLREDGLRPPQSLAELATRTRFWVTAGQEGPQIAPSATAVEAEGVAIKLLTFESVADVLSVSPSTVKRLVSHGALPAVRVGRGRRVKVADLDAYVAGLGEPTAKGA